MVKLLFKLGVFYCTCGYRARTIGLTLELGPTRATGSTWSLVGGVGEPGWAKSPVGCVWAGLRLELCRAAIKIN